MWIRGGHIQYPYRGLLLGEILPYFIIIHVSNQKHLALEFQNLLSANDTPKHQPCFVFWQRDTLIRHPRPIRYIIIRTVVKGVRGDGARARVADSQIFSAPARVRLGYQHWHSARSLRSTKSHPRRHSRRRQACSDKERASTRRRRKRRSSRIRWKN